MRRYLQFRELGGFVRREWVAFERLREALIHIRTSKLSRPPSSNILDAHSTISAAAHPRLLHLGMAKMVTRAFFSNMSTLLRPTQTRIAGSLPLPSPIAGHTRTHVSERIRAATIAHNIEYEKTRNLTEPLVWSSHKARVGINRVRLPILLVVS